MIEDIRALDTKK